MNRCYLPFILLRVAAICLSLSLLSSGLVAQRVFEKGDDAIYEDAQKKQTNLGLGFSPVLTREGKVALIRGHVFDYGAKFDCTRKETKNWVSIYDPATKGEKVIFDRALLFNPDFPAFCVFWQMDMSHDGSLLYLISPTAAASGSLAIINLKRGDARYVPGVCNVYVIRTGPHRGELIYVRRLYHRVPGEEGEYPYYPFVHARPNGQQVRVVSEEHFLVGSTEAPQLEAYLRRIGGRIEVDGKPFPPARR